jgi:hypothetical protein
VQYGPWGSTGPLPLTGPAHPSSKLPKAPGQTAMPVGTPQRPTLSLPPNHHRPPSDRVLVFAAPSSSPVTAHGQSEEAFFLFVPHLVSTSALLSPVLCSTHRRVDRRLQDSHHWLPPPSGAPSPSCAATLLCSMLRSTALLDASATLSYRSGLQAQSLPPRVEHRLETLATMKICCTA